MTERDPAAHAGDESGRDPETPESDATAVSAPHDDPPGVDPAAADTAIDVDHHDERGPEVGQGETGQDDGTSAPQAPAMPSAPRVNTSRTSRGASRPTAVRPVRAPIAGLRQRMESTAALRRALDAREAEAQDLRASINRLRQELAEEPGSPATTHPANPTAPAARELDLEAAETADRADRADRAVPVRAGAPAPGASALGASALGAAAGAVAAGASALGAGSGAGAGRGDEPDAPADSDPIEVIGGPVAEPDADRDNEPSDEPVDEPDGLPGTGDDATTGSVGAAITRERPVALDAGDDTGDDAELDLDHEISTDTSSTGGEIVDDVAAETTAETTADAGTHADADLDTDPGAGAAPPRAWGAGAGADISGIAPVKSPAAGADGDLDDELPGEDGGHGRNARFTSPTSTIATSSTATTPTGGVPVSPVRLNDDDVEMVTIRQRAPWTSWLWLVLAGLVALALLLVVTRCGSSTSSTPSSGATPAGASTAGAAASSGAAGSPAGSGTAANSANGTASSAPATGGTAAAITPMPWPGGATLTPPGMPTTGPGLSAPGTHTELALDADGKSVDVYESTQLAAGRTEPLTLTPQKLSSQAGTPQLDQVQVELDGKPAVVSHTGNTWTASTADGSAYTKAVVRYRMSGNRVTQTPAKAGRYTVLIAPPTAALSKADGKPVEIRSTEKGIVAVECPTAPITQRLCGAPKDGAWTITIPAETDPQVAYLVIDKG